MIYEGKADACRHRLLEVYREIPFTNVKPEDGHINSFVATISAMVILAVANLI